LSAHGRLPAPVQRNDWLTVAAIALIAMCVVTFDHEALGHGGACLALHGRIRLLTSSLFRCDIRSSWIDPAGPAGNLLVGTLALVASRVVPSRRPGLRLFLILVTAFSYFWEGGYLIRAMLMRDGDLYFFARFLLGELALWQRAIAAIAGLALYVFAVRLTASALSTLWPEPRVAGATARIAWMSATIGAGVAALAYNGPGWGDLTDSLLEIAAASLPLLFIRSTYREEPEAHPVTIIARSPAMIALAVVIYGTFIATLGRGIAA
jgi:hypothetical protein